MNKGTHFIGFSQCRIIASSLRSFMSGQSIYKATHSHKKVRCYILAQFAKLVNFIQPYSASGLLQSVLSMRW